MAFLFFSYNFERLSNKMSRTERYMDFRSAIPEAYFPKLNSLISSRTYPARVANQKLSNLRRETDQVIVDLEDMERWRDRIFDAINSGVAKNVRSF